MKKTIIGILILVVIAFGIYNINWYYSYSKFYNKFTKNMNKVSERYYKKKEGDYEYFIATPNYLLYDGNYNIKNVNDDVKDDLLIWYNAKTKELNYGYMVLDNKVVYQVEFDDNYKADAKQGEEFVAENQKIIDKYYKKIVELQTKANEFWKFDEFVD